MDIRRDYKKYRWFFTSTKKLVIGGKSSLQNDKLLRSLKVQENNFIVMHTASPGSPFSVIFEDILKVSSQDIKECATFTACFGKSWKSGSKFAKIDIFNLKSLHKRKNMKEGAWLVKGKVKTLTVPLELVLVFQEKKLRAIPRDSAKELKILYKILPGKISKLEMIAKLQTILPSNISQQEILSALPAGGIRIIKNG